MIAIVVATDKNRVIGEGNKIPWHIRSDFIRLANLTRGRTVILGRRTYDSMVWYYNRSGRRMPGSCYIIVTEVQAEVDGDSYFPPLDMSEWREVSREHHAKNEQDDHNTEVIVLERR
jgi:dihydrofolate reductase